MPKPLTEFLSVSAPTLNFSVSHIPLNTSARKKRFSRSPSFGRGTFTKGIRTLQKPLGASSVVRCRRRGRHRGRALRHVHEPYLAPLRLEVEVARVAVEVGEEERRDEEPRQPEGDGDALPRRRQVEPRRRVQRRARARRLQRVEPAPAVERLER